MCICIILHPFWCLFFVLFFVRSINTFHTSTSCWLYLSEFIRIVQRNIWRHHSSIHGREKWKKKKVIKSSENECTTFEPYALCRSLVPFSPNITKISLQACLLFSILLCSLQNRDDRIHVVECRLQCSRQNSRDHPKKILACSMSHHALVGGGASCSKMLLAGPA